MSLTLTRRHNVDRFGYLIPTKYGNLPMVGAVATYRPGEGRFGGAVAVEEGTENLITPPIRATKGSAHGTPVIKWSESEGYEISGTTGGSGNLAFIVEGNRSPLDSDISTVTISLEEPKNVNRWVIQLRDSNDQTIDGTNISFPGWSWNQYYQGYFREYPTDSVTELTLTLPTTGVRKVAVGFRGSNVGDVTSCKKLQVEAKPFATSFVDGTRPDGILAYPIALPENHTIACYRKSHTDEDYRHVVKLSDGTVFVDGVEDSEYDVGWIAGRNLLKDTTSEWTTLVRPEGSWFYEKGTSYQVEVGETYTFSIFVEKVSEDSVPINLHLGLGRSPGQYNWDCRPWRMDNIPFGSRVSITYTITESDVDDGSRTYFAWRLRNERLATTIRFKDVKLEKGNRATDWTPAPEDLGYDGDTLMLSNQTGLVDELLVLPYAASEEEIASWYEAQGPLPPHPQALLQWDWQAVRPAQKVKL